MKLETKIKKLYNNPAIGLIEIDTFLKKLLEYNIDIELDELKNVLSKEESYTINKPAKTKFIIRKVLVYYVYEQLQADLVFTDTKQTGLASQNDNYKYL